MAVVIRLARHGSKKHPYYHIVVTDSRNARNSGKILERIGSHNPMLPREHTDRTKFDSERATYWMGVGAKPSDRVYRFFANAGLVAKREAPVQTKQHLQKEKTLLKIKDKEDKLRKIAEAKAAEEAKLAEEAAAAKAAAEAPAEPVATETQAEAVETTETAAE